MTLTAITRSHSSGLMSTIFVERRMPALLTSTSTPPNSATVRATMALTCPGSATLTCIGTTRWPSAVIAAATAATVSAF